MRGSAVQSREGKFHAALLQLQAEERRLLELRTADVRRRLGQSQSVLVLGTLLGLLIVAAAGWTLQRRNSGRGLAEQALHDSDEQYRMLLDGVQDYAIFMLDPQGKFVSWNAGAERITGYKAEEIIGQTTVLLLLSRGDQARQARRRCSASPPRTATTKSKACGYGRTDPAS